MPTVPDFPGNASGFSPFNKMLGIFIITLKYL